VFGRTGRGKVRTALDVDDGTWNRARGFALHQEAMIIPYYGETNPGFVALAKRTVEEVVADINASDKASSPASVSIAGSCFTTTALRSRTCLSEPSEATPGC
jgi:hypothetical protein